MRLSPKIRGWTVGQLHAAFGRPATQPIHRAGKEYKRKGAAPTHVTDPIPTTHLLTPQILAPDTPVVLSELSRSVISSASVPEVHGTAIQNEYSPPERFWPCRIGSALDVWALACTIFELRTGVGLFDHTFAEVVDHALRRPSEHGWPPIQRAAGSPQTGLWGAFDCVRGTVPLSDSALPFDSALPSYISRRLEAAFARPDAARKHETQPEATTHAQLAEHEMRLPRHECAPKYQGPLLASIAQEPMAEEEVALLKDLLLKTLTFRPEDRLTMFEMMAHGFFQCKESVYLSVLELQISYMYHRHWL